MYKRELTVLPSDSSCLGHIKLHSLLNYLQDTASLAVSDLEGTASQLMARGYAWILTRYEVEVVASLPALDEDFTVETFHDPGHGYGCLRVFQVSRRETPLAWMKTSWLLLDLAAGRPVRPLSHLPEITRRDTAPIDPDFRDIPGFPPGAEVLSVPCPIRFHDLDANGHVNNAVYFEWVFEATPLDLMKYEVRSLSAFFRSGARWGDSLEIQIAELPAGKEALPPGPEPARSFVYHIVNRAKPNEKPMTTFFCSWEARP